MSDDLSPEFQRELLDDFYTESDELLRQLRASLTALEREGRAGLDRETLEALYRSAHTFKGICGIVGLRSAEQLAHAAEDLLRNVSRGVSTLGAETFDLLGRTLQRLEQIVAAHRLGEPLPETADLLVSLESYRVVAPPAETSAAPGESALEPESPAPAAAVPAGTRFHVTFSPSRELDQRGINVTSVRQRLSALGVIAQATPQVRADGTMQFEFTAILRETPDAAAWANDGITVAPYPDVEPAASGGRDDPARGPAESARGTASADAHSSRSIAPAHIVRVDLGRLDTLMRIMGEMVIHRSRLEERIANAEGDKAPLQEVAAALGRSLRDLRSAITRVRLVPVDEIFNRLPFLVRDLARETNKKVRLVTSGSETEIDKYLVERLKEPLLHLVRNAISHGVERPQDRVAAGKREEATISLRAFASGHTVVIEVRDDGGGIDARKILERAAALGLPAPEAPTDADILALLCQPGFTTREEADLAAGRGVGMSVVHTTVRELGGLLTLSSQPGEWTQFTLRLPLTLSIADTVIVSAGTQTCAVPQSFIEQVIEFEEQDVRVVKQTEVIPYHDGVLPIVRLAAFLGTNAQRRTRLPALVITSERGSTALVVDRVHTQREVVVRPMNDPLLQVRGVSGATELGDGRPVLILDPAALTNGVVRPTRSAPRSTNASTLASA